jgi:hypothetical protein
VLSEDLLATCPDIRAAMSCKSDQALAAETVPRAALGLGVPVQGSGGIGSGLSAGADADTLALKGLRPPQMVPAGECLECVLGQECKCEKKTKRVFFCMPFVVNVSSLLRPLFCCVSHHRWHGHCFCHYRWDCCYRYCTGTIDALVSFIHRAEQGTNLALAEPTFAAQVHSLDAVRRLQRAASATAQSQETQEQVGVHGCMCVCAYWFLGICVYV